jgi:hypothetical protein
MTRTNAASKLAYLFFVGSVLQAVFAQPAERGDGTGSLELVAKKVSERYCEADDELATLRIRSKLQFINTGQNSVILWKDSGEIQRVLVAQNHEEARAKHYMQQFSIMTITAAQYSDLKVGPRPTDSFVVIPPGDSWEQVAEPIIFVARVESNIYGLSPGKYVVQFDVAAWPETEEIGEILSGRWKKWGVLWTRPVVRSAPLPIEVVKNPKVENCP